MGKEDPDLYSAILGGLSFVLGQQSIKNIALEPFKPVENQQELEDDLLSDDDLGDLDLGDLDLEEIDLSGLEEDIQINDEDLGDLSDFDELKEFVENELEVAPEVKLLPSQYNVLKVLYNNKKRYPMADNMSADSIRIVLEQDNIVYAHNQILKYLGELVDFEFVNQKMTLGTGLIFSITPEGIDFFEKLPKSKTVGQIREEKKQEKAKKTGDGLDYDYYLIASILNQSVNTTVTAGIVTAILQSSFKKNPQWDESEILSKLHVLTSLGMALRDVQNSIEYFEITELGEEVVKYLIIQENKGLYPKSNPTQETVALRPSPTESATLNIVGSTKMGNDGNLWIVKENKNGVKRWVKI